MAKFSYNILAEIFFENKNGTDVMSYILNDPFFKFCDQKSLKSHKLRIRNFLSRLEKRYNECSRIKEKMLQHNHKWLTNELIFEKPYKIVNSGGKIGRPVKPIDESSERSRRRKLKDTNAKITDQLIKDSFFYQVGPPKNKKIKIDIIKKTVIASPNRVKRILKSIPTPNEEKKFTPEEALALFLDLKLTAHQYMELRKRTNQKNCAIFPGYKEIISTKKDCLPPQESIYVTENSAEVKLQNILNHTAERLLKTLNERSIKNLGNCSLTLISKWGCDGSSGQKQYKQRNVENSSDSNLFMISFVPLRLKKNILDFEPSTSTSTELDIWKNEVPSSTKLCRPIKFTFKKETKDLIIEEVSKMREQINLLEPITFDFDGQKIEINYKMLLTMIDGKVAQALTNTKSSSSCIICKKNFKSAKPNSIRRQVF